MLYFWLLVWLLSLPSDVCARLYKWVDDEGVIHYSDKLPPAQSDKRHSVLDETGVTRERVRAAKSAEELAEDRRQAAVRKEQERAARERAFRDKILLDTFSSERDLIITRDERLATLDSIIRITEKSLAKQEKKLAAISGQIIKFEEKNAIVPDSLMQRREELTRQIRRKTGELEGRLEERAKLAARFEADLERFRQLRELRGF